MENQRQKWVNLSMLAFAGLVSFVVLSLLNSISAAYDLEARVRNLDLVLRGISLLVAVGVFAFLKLHKVSNRFVDEAVLELSRVTWPTRNDTFRATIVVMIMVVISGVALGGLDAIWSWALKLIL